MSGRTRAKAPAPKPAPSEAELEALSFEQALERLEGLVDRLEEGDLELEDALAAFEQGVALTRRCAGQLEEAERRVETLVNEGGRWVGKPFDATEEGD